MGEVFGSGWGDTFQFRSASWKHDFCVRDRLGGGFVRTTSEDGGKGKCACFTE